MPGKPRLHAGSLLVAVLALLAASAAPAARQPAVVKAHGIRLKSIAASIVAGSITPPAALPRAPGWEIGTARIRAAGCDRCVQVDSWAATVPYRDAPNDFPHRTMATLGRHDVIIQLSRSWEPSPPRWVYTKRPLQIRRAQIHANFEGNTTRGRVSLWSSATWRNGSLVQVYVFFGAPSPCANDVARAQHELDHTQFPNWSMRT